MSFWKDAEDQKVEPLNSLQMQLCDRFIEEYLHDHDVFLAAIRCGFAKSSARDFGDRIFFEPYTQRKLREIRKGEADLSKKKRDRKDEEMVREMLVNMSKRAYPASQVAALGKLIGVLGMNAPIKTENTNTTTHRGNVMAVPGIVADMDAWQNQAQASQKQLASETRANT